VDVTYRKATGDWFFFSSRLQLASGHPKAGHSSCIAAASYRERLLTKATWKGAAGIMATTTKTKVAAKTSRYNELKKMLEERRRELLNAVQGKIRDVRAEGSKDRDVLDQGESSEVDIQEDIEFALIQMKSETLTKVDGGLAPARGRQLRRLLRVR
jgi:hypothetical protein